ncbi:hypothetical protein A1O3_01475 [Capronia epimyces CBS 606.96]|uniref:Amino acid permease/ SLC12A domain-containing protein n=1 Tax=Capronia epimyces CBS 606.96 TaxID=1182542 RepID=W9ZEK5_9EURO|nr:uncharacterized protein A1O3_01475 [Capronia epimyces CBS 606.96]EXJ92919.1 hypothetical protein A1O3_01475 [Capronia epimyces CBS 606.96]
MGSEVNEVKTAGMGQETAEIPSEGVVFAYDTTKRHLKPRHIQLLGIGGTIGTVLFVGIGRGLINGGPASLLISFTFWCTTILAVTNCLSEMISYLPIPSPFITLAGRFVDDAFGVATGFNFFLLEAFLVPFELTAINIVIHFWTDKIPVAAVVAIGLVLYALINVFGVKYFGTTEFYLSMLKILLVVGLTMYTLVTMSGGNPTHHAYGFQNWSIGGSFVEYYTTGATGRFLGFLQTLVLATVTVTGPELVSMAAGEAENPRKVMPRAYKAVFWRLGLFFVLGALCVGIVLPANSVELAEAYATSGSNASSSPYVVSMRNFGIPVLPHIVNAVLVTSAFSAGNGYFFAATRTLYGLSLRGKAPRIFSKTTKNGSPIYSVAAVLAIGTLAFMQVSNSSAKVFSWIVSLVTGGMLINYAANCYTYLKFRKACLVQGLPREKLPYVGYLQPYMAYYGIFWCTVMILLNGWTVFLNGNWDTPSFFFSYTMVGVFPVVYVAWKVIKRTKIIPSDQVDLMLDVAEIEAYEASYVPRRST